MMDPTRLMRMPATLRSRRYRSDREDGYEVDVSGDVGVELVIDELDGAPGVWIEQAGASEDNVNGEQQAEQWNAYLPPSVEIDGLDELDVGGLRYQVVGNPWTVTNPRTGTVTHHEAKLARAGHGEADSD